MGGGREGMSKKITPTGQKTHRKNKKGTFWEKMVRHFNIKGHFKKQKRYIKGALIQENVHCYLKRGIFFYGKMLGRPSPPLTPKPQNHKTPKPLAALYNNYEVKKRKEESRKTIRYFIR